MNVTISIVISLLYLMTTSVKVFSQNEVEKYKLPKVIEGFNLLVSGSSAFSAYNFGDSDRSSYANASLGANFMKWRYARRLDYSLGLRTALGYSRNSYEEFQTSEVTTHTQAFITVEGALSYYVLNNLLYTGLSGSSRNNFSSFSKPFSQSDLYTYVGFGRLINAEQVNNAKNFEKVLVDANIITKKLPAGVFTKLIALLDKKRGNEFWSKYKDDQDIEFYSQVEELLTDEKIISAPLSSRLTLKLFQALTNINFIKYPKYKGYSVQAELGYENIGQVDGFTNHISLFLLVSGVYGLPIGLKADIALSMFAGLPLNKDTISMPDIFFYHSPLTTRGLAASYFPQSNYWPDENKYRFVAGLRLISYYNFTPTAGVSGYVNVNYGNVKDAKSDYSIRTIIEFRYNILSRMMLGSYLEFYRDRQPNTRFDGGVNLSYYVF